MISLDSVCTLEQKVPKSTSPAWCMSSSRIQAVLVRPEWIYCLDPRLVLPTILRGKLAKPGLLQGYSLWAPEFCNLGPFCLFVPLSFRAGGTAWSICQPPMNVLCLSLLSESVPGMNCPLTCFCLFLQAGTAILLCRLPVLPGTESLLLSPAALHRLPERDSAVWRSDVIHGQLPWGHHVPHVYGRISYRLQKSPAVHCPEVSAERGGSGISGAFEDLSPFPCLPRFIWLGVLVPRS